MGDGLSSSNEPDESIVPDPASKALIRHPLVCRTTRSLRWAAFLTRCREERKDNWPSRWLMMHGEESDRLSWSWPMPCSGSFSEGKGESVSRTTLGTTHAAVDLAHCSFWMVEPDVLRGRQTLGLYRRGPLVRGRSAVDTAAPTPSIVSTRGRNRREDCIFVEDDGHLCPCPNIIDGEKSCLGVPAVEECS